MNIHLRSLPPYTCMTCTRNLARASTNRQRRLFTSTKRKSQQKPADFSKRHVKPVQQGSTTETAHASEELRTLPQHLGYYWDTDPPNSAQLAFASQYFISSPLAFLFSASKFRDLPTSLTPEVVFLGRSNVGKSSLLNALLNRNKSHVAHVSSKPGRTKLMNAFGVGKGMEEFSKGTGQTPETQTMRIGAGGLLVMDVPGYGHASRAEWGEEIIKYLTRRKELRRAFVLVDSEHGLKKSDEQLLALMRQHGVPHQIVLSKVDKIILPTQSKNPSPLAIHTRLQKLDSIFQTIREKTRPANSRGAGIQGEILACSAEKSILPGKYLGIDSLRWAVLQAVGLESDSKGRKRKVDIQLSDESED